MIAKNKFERMKAKSLAKKNAISQQDNITEVDAVAVPKKSKLLIGELENIL